MMLNRNKQVRHGTRAEIIIIEGVKLKNFQIRGSLLTEISVSLGKNKIVMC